MAELTYRDAVIRGIAQEMARDPDVVFLGEDIAKAGGVFKATVGLYEQFGPLRVRDTPISEQAILGAAMGAAMTGLKPIAEIMFSDFIAVCFDYIANEFPKSRYMTNGQVKVPLVVRTGNGGGARFGAQHSQSVENWCMMIPGLKVVAPSSPVDVIGLLAASVRDPDPVIFLEHKSLYATKGEVPDGEIVDTLGTAKIVRPGKDATILALALMVPRALAAAEKLKSEHGIDCEVVDVRSLVPIDTQTILGSVARTHRLFTVEENPRLCGWGAEIVSIVADEAFYDLDGRRCASPRRTSRCRPPTFWKTSRCRPPTASPIACGAASIHEWRKSWPTSRHAKIHADRSAPRFFLRTIRSASGT
jgi:pyruvate dehydrogenase E1 component beta subunit